MVIVPLPSAQTPPPKTEEEVVRLFEVPRPDDLRSLLATNHQVQALSRAAVVKHRARCLAGCANQRDTLRQLLRKWDPFEVLGRVGIAIHVAARHGIQSLACIEFLAQLLLLEDGYIEGIAPGWDPLMEILDRTAWLFICYTILDLWEELDPRTLTWTDPKKQLRAHVRQEGATMRVAQFPDEVRKLQGSLFIKFDAYLLKTPAFGFTFTNALSIDLAIERILDRKINQPYRALRSHIKKRLAGEHPCPVPAPEELVAEVIAIYQSLGSKAAGSRIYRHVLETTRAADVTVTAAELSAEADVPVGQTTALLDFMSYTFGELPEEHNLEPSQTPPLESRPLLKRGDRYLLTTYLAPAFYPRLLQAFARDHKGIPKKERPRKKDEIQAQRKEVTEAYVAELLRTLHMQNVYREAGWRQGSQAGEIDVLGELSDGVLLVQVKAGVLSSSARRGGERLWKDLDKFFRHRVNKPDDGYNQCLRAQTFIDTEVAPLFECKDGRSFKLDKGRHKRIQHIIVTLEPLNPILPEALQLRHVGYFKGPVLPWCVSIFDLQSACQSMIAGSELLAYAELRVALELEYPGHRLQDELFWLEAFHRGALQRGSPPPLFQEPEALPARWKEKIEQRDRIPVMKDVGHAPAKFLFRVSNHHTTSCGEPPEIDGDSTGSYHGYFENEHGEQMIFRYDGKRGTLWAGDAGWETPYEVVDGAVAGLILGEAELTWLRACWEAAAARPYAPPPS